MSVELKWAANACIERSPRAAAPAPGAVVAAAIRLSEGPHSPPGAGCGWLAACEAAGHSRPDSGAPKVDASTIFDLASVSKSFTALTVARLVRKGVLDWGAELCEMLPELKGAAVAHSTLEALLAHRAGLEGHARLGWTENGPDRAIDRTALLRDAAHRLIPRSPGDAEDAETGRTGAMRGPVYSDLGYLLAGEAIARACGKGLDEVLFDEVMGPLGLDGIASARQWRRWSRTRGDGNGESFEMRVAPTESVPWRGGTIVGAVHDENAWIFANFGACGHAGLFGTAPTLVRFGCAILDMGKGLLPQFLTPGELEPLTRVRKGGTLRAGFDGKSLQGSSAGSLFGHRSFGHLGFTGTSIWIDPDAQLVGVLLTNRVHPTRENDAIRRVRPVVYDAVAAWGARVQGGKHGHEAPFGGINPHHTRRPKR